MPNPDPEPQPDVNVGVNVDVMKPKKDDGSDINVDVNVNIDEVSSMNTTMSPTTMPPTTMPPTTMPPTTTIATTTICSEEAGYMVIPGSNKCMKLFLDTTRTWSQAFQKCQDEGLVMAETEDPVALRSYLMNTQGLVSGKAWLGAKGDGSNMIWNSDNSIVASSDSGYWYYRDTTSTYCLSLLTYPWYLTNYPARPYYCDICTIPNYWTLCELL